MKQYFDGAKSMLPKALRINPFVPAHTDAPPSDERPPLLSSSFMINIAVIFIHDKVWGAGCDPPSCSHRAALSGRQVSALNTQCPFRALMTAGCS